MFLGFDLFLSNRLYGKRPLTHFRAFQSEPGWYFVEVSSWTLEVTTPSPKRMLAGAAVVAIATKLALMTEPAQALCVDQAITYTLTKARGLIFGG